MKIAIFEVCRSPELVKITEPVLLSTCFKKKGIDYELYSNDLMWPKQVRIDKNFLQTTLANSDIDVVHLAMHGDNYSFILKWSESEHIRQRRAQETLTGLEILEMSAWHGKLIVSGACHSATLAHYFLDAGATAVVAPTIPISWPSLGDFFCVFYDHLFSGSTIKTALQAAIAKFPEYDCYQLHTL